MGVETEEGDLLEGGYGQFCCRNVKKVWNGVFMGWGCWSQEGGT